MMKLKLLKGQNIHVMDYISIIALVVMIIVFTCINKNFLGVMNLKNIFADLAPLLAISCGVTFVLLMGSMDLSIGSICSCCAVIFVVMLPKLGYGAYIIAMLFGVVAGMVNGIIYTRVKIPSFIVTLGAMSVWQSAAFLLSKGAPLQLPVKYYSYVAWGKIKFGVIPMFLIVGLTILVILYFVQARTYTGKAIIAVGANERAARIAGIHVNYAKIMGFTLCGLGCGLSGILLSVKLKSGIPTVGVPFTLQAVAAVALGGTSLSGGKGNMFGTLLGVAFVTVIQNGINIVGVSTYWQQVVFGILVIFAVYMTVDRKGRNVVIK